nr:MAG TPA: hypothetical protein [Caudoviricetes sp.]
MRKICSVLLFPSIMSPNHLLSLAHKRVQLFVTNYLSKPRLA